MLGQKNRCLVKQNRVLGAWSKNGCLVKKNRVLGALSKYGCLVKKTGCLVKIRVLGAWSKYWCLVKTQCLVELQVLGLTKVKAQRTSQGERLTTSRSEITDEPTYALVRFCCLVVDEVEFVIVDVILIKCCVELTFDFCA